MSHIPSAAMPHAKTHEPTPAPIVQPKRLPWLAIAIGGALALGGGLAMARSLRTPAKPKRRVARKPRSTTTPRRRGKPAGRGKAGASRAAPQPAD